MLERLEHNSCRYNLGTGTGSSVREVLTAVERVAGRPVPIVADRRRDGDPPVLVAESAAFTADTGWSPRIARLDEIVATAWRWRKSHPQGYGPAKARLVSTG